MSLSSARSPARSVPALFVTEAIISSASSSSRFGSARSSFEAPIAFSRIPNARSLRAKLGRFVATEGYFLDIPVSLRHIDGSLPDRKIAGILAKSVAKAFACRCIKPHLFA
jgi:hypothetical protein